MTRLAAVLLSASSLIVFAVAPLPRPAPPAHLPGIAARSIGPATMGGRITSVAVVENRPAIQYIGAAAGGVWKTTDDGLSWQCVFEGRPLASIGAVAVAPSNPSVVYAGTGEANPRNSVSWGNGVFISRDAGKTWKHAGLTETQHIGKIVVHPKEPDVAHVAALGHLWGANAERGVFSTKDGGKTWDHSLKLDADTGVIDLALDHSEPQTIYAAAYCVRRDGFSAGNPATQFGSKAGLYRSRDGGKTWTKMTKGLPDRPLGRCGVTVWKKDPRVLYAVVQTDQTDIRVVAGQRPGHGPVQTGGLFRSNDRGDTWVKVNDLCPRPFYYGQVRIDPGDDNRVWVLGVRLFVTENGGKTFRDNAARTIHVDHHDLWINPIDPRHMILGNDGGLYYSRNQSQTWAGAKNLPISQFYGVAVDMRVPYRIYGGLQDNGSWGGPSRTNNQAGILNSDWGRVLGSDGFYCQVPPDDPNTVYAEAQYGRPARIELLQKRQVNIKPRQPARFNWSSPLLLSAHNTKTLYYGGNYLFKSLDRGAAWRAISPDLTRGKAGVVYRSSGHTLTTIAESPLKPGLLYVGSDDGRIHVTQDDGQSWTDLSTRVPNVLQARWISRLEASPHAEGTVYLALTRYRNDDRAPYLYRSDDYGQTWRSLAAGLAAGGPVYVIKTDARNRNLLYAGTELGLYVSLDGGGHWSRLGEGLPLVPVHDVVVHPRARELVVGTHGRGIHILDVAPLQDFTPKVWRESAHLFEIAPAGRQKMRQQLPEARTYSGSNPPVGAAIYFWLRQRSKVRLEVISTKGKVMELPAATEAGLHRIVWDLREAAGKAEVPVAPGDYFVRLTVDGARHEQKLKVLADK